MFNYLNYLSHLHIIIFDILLLQLQIKLYRPLDLSMNYINKFLSLHSKDLHPCNKIFFLKISNLIGLTVVFQLLLD